MGTRAPDTVKRLVEQFDRNFDSLHTSAYNETQLRIDYLDPLFESLGWDVANRKGYDQRYREVVHEDAVRIGGTTKAPDYCFRIGGVRRFFVEAKAPFRDIGRDPAPAFQLRRYAWTAKLPLSILTDFEEFGVYDTRLRPSERDKAGAARVRLVGFRDYEAQWEELAGLFSPEAIQRGAFERFVETGRKKGTTPVDAEFLKDIEGWRDLLARNIALRNPRLGDRDLNAAVQRTIDRLIFLRICEDRGIEPAENLKTVAAGDRVYRRLFDLFRKADARYNSGLFHFADEKGREEPDDLTPGLKADDAALKTIIGQLYYPSPYEFSVFPADILGQVYEQFLGKVIRLTAGHRAKVEEKPEVRKAGGVYYTPTYIVDYIVKNTVGKLLEGKTPKAVARLRILDPACGSGSFLLGAYQHLLDWHRDRYVEDGQQKHRAELYEGPGGEWRLTTQEKKRILLNNIYGVDIDSQAVEVTKLSLLLKVLEGESDQTIENQLKMFSERALPDLAANIKCGNSLIGSDFWQGEQQALFADESQRIRINAFDWDREFPDIIKAGGFDAVIGNPPYLRIQGLQEYYGNQIPYFLRRYDTAEKRFDLSILFTERGFGLLHDGGRLGYICPHKFVNTDYGSGLRRFLRQRTAIESFVSFGNNLIFEQASTYTGILLLTKADRKGLRYFEFDDTPRLDIAQRLFAIGPSDETVVSYDDIDDQPWVLPKKQAPSVLRKLSRQQTKLRDACDEILVGVQSGIDNVHVLEAAGKGSPGRLRLRSARAQAVVEIEADLLKPFLRGEDVHRYAPPEHECYCVYPYELRDGKTVILEEAELKERFPLGYAYLKEYRSELTDIRRRQKTNLRYWYSCHRPRDMHVFERQRVVTPYISLGCNMTLAPGGLYHNTKVYSILPAMRRERDLLYWLGLLNSMLVWWFMSNTGYVLRGGYYAFTTDYLGPFPVVLPDGDDRPCKPRMVESVERMLELHKNLPKAKGEAKTSIERAIAATDKQIDELVYELYGLTDKEIRIVEGAI